MKQLKSTIYKSSMLSFALVMLLSGCSSKAKTDTSSAPATSTAATGSSTVPTIKPDEELPPVELTWYYGVGAQQPGQQEAEDAVNKYLKENTKLNATLKLKPVDFGSYDQKMNVSIASNEAMDIVWTTGSWLLKYNENVKKGTFLAIDDLLPQYATKTLSDLMPERFWADVKSDTDSKIYAVPSYQISAASFGYVFQKRFVDKYKFDITTVKTQADLEPFLETLKKNEPDIIPFAYQAGNNGPTDPELLDYANLTYDTKDPFKSLEKRATPQYKAFLDLMHSWYGKGYIYQDLATVKDFNQLMAKGNIAVMTDVTFKPGGEAGYPAKNGGQEVVRQRITNPLFSGVTTSMNAISKTSKNPERALMLLELVNNDKALYDLLCYGVKGTHYDEVDGVYTPVKDSTYAPNIDWVFGNQFNGLLRPGQPKDVFEQTKKLNEEAEIHPMNGFHFNDSKLKTEVAAVNAVRAEYSIPLETGVADPNVTLPKFLDALKKAGNDKIQLEMNKQLADWAAKNGK